MKSRAAEQYVCDDSSALFLIKSMILAFCSHLPRWQLDCPTCLFLMSALLLPCVGLMQDRRCGMVQASSYRYHPERQACMAYRHETHIVCILCKCKPKIARDATQRHCLWWGWESPCLQSSTNGYNSTLYAVWDIYNALHGSQYKCTVLAMVNSNMPDLSNKRDHKH